VPHIVIQNDQISDFLRSDNMISREGVDIRDVVVRPCQNNSWQVEFSHDPTPTVLIFNDQPTALRVAMRDWPNVAVRILPAQ
jgi:hypothetical protein